VIDVSKQGEDVYNQAEEITFSIKLSINWILSETCTTVIRDQSLLTFQLPIPFEQRTHLGSSQDSQERPLRLLKSLGKELQLLLHQESCGPLWEVNTDHGRVSSVGGSESVVDVDCSELG
jgi:hypothetical protein